MLNAQASTPGNRRPLSSVLSTEDTPVRDRRPVTEKDDAPPLLLASGSRLRMEPAGRRAGTRPGERPGCRRLPADRAGRGAAGRAGTGRARPRPVRALVL